MYPFTRNTILSLLAGGSLVALTGAPAAAYRPDALLVAPEPDHCPGHLPRFGFSSFNIAGVGERITLVRPGSRAARLGLEPGDIIVRLNGFPLSYHGAGNDALRHAVASGGWVRLTIRDVRTGRLVARHTYVGEGGIGPITPKLHLGGYLPHEWHDSYHSHVPGAPKFGPEHGTSHTLKKLAKLFD
jgi:hypothetical protein